MMSLRVPIGKMGAALLLLLASLSPRLNADNVTLAWDPSADPTVVGYNLYSGTTSRNYTNLISAGNATSATISNLVPGVTYYFAATTYTLAGLESDYSTEATYTVPSANQPPTLDAIPNLTVNENGGTQTVNLTGISSGATNEAQTLTVTASSSNPNLIPNPTINYTSPNTTGTLSLTPTVNANGTATIAVTVNDGGASNNTVVRSFTVTVNPVNVQPTLDAIANLTVNENAGVQTVNLTGISSGAANENQTLTVTATSSNPSIIPNPTVNYTSPNTTGTLSLAPAVNANGTATIAVTVNDGGTSNNTVVRSFTVTVNPVNVQPTLDAIANLTVNENAGAQTVNLTGISSGAANETQTLTVTASSSNPSIIFNPTVSYTSPNATGTLSLTPAVNAYGTATIAVTVNDGGASNNTVVRSFTVTVNPVNVQPTLDPIANLTVNENAGAQTVSLTGISSGAANETQTLTVTASSSNPSIIPNPTVSYTSPNTTGTLSLTPAANAYGTATIAVTVNDGGASNNTVVRSFTVTVNAVNVQPTLDPIANLTVNENSGAQTVNLTGISSGAANEAQTLTVTASSSNPSIIPNPTVSYTSPNTTGTLSLTPAANAYGTATMAVTVNDGGASNNTVVRSFTVTVNPANVQPTLDAIANLTVNENAGAQMVNLTGISSGTANEAQTLTVTASSSNPSIIPNPTVNYTSPNTTGTLSLTPAANAYGTATIAVTVNDGGASNNTVVRSFTVTVNPANVQPTLDAIANLTVNENAGAQTVNLTGISSGAANETQTLTVTASSSNPSIIPNPTVSYTSPNTTGTLSLTPTVNANGTATIAVTVNDGGASNNTVVRSFTVTVNPVNVQPTLDAIANLTVNENAGAQTVNLTGISSGAANETQTLTVTASSSNPSIIPNPTVSYTSPNTTGTLSLTPAANAYGTATIAVTVNDGGASNNTVVRSFTVTVNAVNVQPTLDPIANLTVNENSGAQTVNLTGISSGAANETQTLTVTASSSNPSIIPSPTVNYTSPNTTGTLSLTPAANGYGTATIAVTVNDGGASNNTVVRSFTVTVNPVTLQPTLDAIADLTINENTGPQTVNLTGISSGAANQNQTLSVSSFSSNPTLVPNPTVNYTSPNTTGTLTFTPAANSYGPVAITVMVDNGAASNNTVIRSFTVTVSPVNARPTINPITDLTLNENAGPQTVNLSGVTSGASNEIQTLTLTASSSNPALIPNPTVSYTSPNATGSLTLSPATNVSGSATISVTVDDGQPTNSSTTVSFVVTVNASTSGPALLTNAIIAPNTAFRFQIPAPYTNGDRFNYSLGTGAPTGAKVSNVRGLPYLTWTPTTAQALTTNLIQIVINDQTHSTLSTNEMVQVIVLDYLGLRLGSASVAAGQSALVPIYLSSSSGVTNLSFTVDWPSAAFVNPTLLVSAPGIGASSLVNHQTNLLINLQTSAGQVLQKSNLIAQVNFQTMATAPSGFMSLPAHDVYAAKPDGTAYVNYMPTAGQVAVVNTKPLLAPGITTDTNRTLTAFGNVGTTYQLQSNSSVSGAGSWLPVMTYTQTNISQTLSVDPSNPFVLYRLLVQ